MPISDYLVVHCLKLVTLIVQGIFAKIGPDLELRGGI